MNIYESRYLHLYLLIPFSLCLLSLFLLQNLKLGIEFTGGFLVTVEGIEQAKLKGFLENHPLATLHEIRKGSYEIHIPISEEIKKIEEEKRQVEELVDLYTTRRTTEEEVKKKIEVITGKYINTSGKSLPEILNDFRNYYVLAIEREKEEIEKELKEIVENYKIVVVSPQLSRSFIENLKMVLLAVFLISSVVVYIFFRKLGPSIIVITGALADLLFSLGGMALFSIPLNPVTISGLLMLLGLSLDTDILLTARVIESSERRKAAYEAMKTGLGMEISTILAFTVLLFTGIFTGISVYYYLGLVVIFGMIGDMIATWLFNTPLLLLYLERVKG